MQNGLLPPCPRPNLPCGMRLRRQFHMFTALQCYGLRFPRRDGAALRKQAPGRQVHSNSATYSWHDCVTPASTSCPAALAKPTQRESPRKEMPRPMPPPSLVPSSLRDMNHTGEQRLVRLGMPACGATSSALARGFAGRAATPLAIGSA